MKRLSSIVSSFTVVLLLGLGACGGKSAPATTSAAATGGEAGAMPAHQFPAEVAAFHDKLSPLWHSEVGPARVEATCTASGELDQLLEDVQNAAAPAGVDAAAWAERVTALRAAMSTLAEDCVATSGAALDGNFTALHDAFHALIALLPNEGGAAGHEHMGHEGHGGH